MRRRGNVRFAVVTLSLANLVINCSPLTHKHNTYLFTNVYTTRVKNTNVIESKAVSWQNIISVSVNLNLILSTVSPLHSSLPLMQRNDVATGQGLSVSQGMSITTGWSRVNMAPPTYHVWNLRQGKAKLNSDLVGGIVHWPCRRVIVVEDLAQQTLFVGELDFCHVAVLLWVSVVAVVHLLAYVKVYTVRPLPQHQQSKHITKPQSAK